jgi:hypothetical protein
MGGGSSVARGKPRLHPGAQRLSEGFGTPMDRSMDLLNAMAFPGRRSCPPMHATACDNAALRVIASRQW